MDDNDSRGLRSTGSAAPIIQIGTWKPSNSNMFQDPDKHTGSSSSSAVRDFEMEPYPIRKETKREVYNDRRDMQRMGKKQELMRNFRVISSIGFTTCVMGTWEILFTTNTQALISGGSAGLFWSMVWTYLGQTFIVLSLAEMASMAPTAGGQYHWVSEFAPRKYQKVLSYVSGWLSALCWQSIVATDCFLTGEIILGMIVVGNPDFQPQRWHGTLLIIASILFIAGFNIYAAKHLPLAEGLFVTFHIFAFFPVVITLWVLAPKVSDQDVFLNFTDNGAEWPSMALAAMVGQVSALYTVLGSDSVAHMSEEIQDAALVVPQSMVWSYVLNMPFAFGILITYLFTVGDIQTAVNDPTGFPFIYAFSQATQGSKGATLGLTFTVLLLIIMITISCLASSSRQTFAFARDKGLPFAKWLSYVDPKYQIPVNSILFTCLFTLLISLINIGSTVAFNAILSLGLVALMGSYILSIGCVLLKRVRGHQLPYARWSLGRAGPTVNLVAFIYASWGFFWSFWPNMYQPTLEQFNWACVLFVGVMAVSIVFYYVQGRHVYDGPVAKVEGRARE